MRSLIVLGLVAVLSVSGKFGPKWNELDNYIFDRYDKDYGLTYEQKFTPETGAALELQPPIHCLSGYTGMAVSICCTVLHQR